MSFILWVCLYIFIGTLIAVTVLDPIKDGIKELFLFILVWPIYLLIRRR